MNMDDELLNVANIFFEESRIEEYIEEATEEFLESVIAIIVPLTPDDGNLPMADQRLRNVAPYIVPWIPVIPDEIDFDGVPENVGVISNLFISRVIPKKAGWHPDLLTHLFYDVEGKNTIALNPLTEEGTNTLTEVGEEVSISLLVSGCELPDWALEQLQDKHVWDSDFGKNV
jgi:hypothetical protein